MTVSWWSTALGVTSSNATPPAPDADQAREWVNQELSKPEYGTQLTWLTRTFRSIIQWFFKIFSTPGSPDSLRGFLILGIIVIVLIVLGVVVWRNPIVRRARSSVVFEEDTSLANAQEQAEQARHRGDWAQAYIWTFRTLVVAMAQREICSAGPGVTAHEASRAICAKLGFSAELGRAALEFDQIRYGKGVPDAADVDQLTALSVLLQTAANQRGDDGKNGGGHASASVLPTRSATHSPRVDTWSPSADSTPVGRQS